MDASYFAGRLRELREAKGWTRTQLAEAAGLKSYAGIRDIELGERAPNWETAIKLCEALGVTPDAFIKEPTDRPKPGRGRPPRKPDDEPTPKRGKRK